MKLLINYLKKPRFLILQIVALILVIGANIFTLVIPALNGRLIDNSFNNGSIDKNTSILIIVSLILSFVLTFFQLFISAYIAERIGFEIKNDLIDKIIRETYAFIDKVTPSKILTNLTVDINNIKNFLSNGINTLITSLITIFGSLILMFKINPTLALIILPILPILIIIFGLIIRKMVRYFKKAQHATDSLNKSIDENIKGSMLVKVFVSEDEEKNKFSKRNKFAQKISINIVKVFSLLIPVINLASFVAIIIVLSVGGTQIANGKLTSGELLAFYQYVQLFIFPIVVLGFISSSIGQVFVSSSRINLILEHEIDFKNGTKSLEKFESLEFKKVNLEFNEDDKKQTVLEEINLEILRGQKIGLIGMTGSGKSMILQLILRFFDPSSGTILLNNEGIENYDIDSLRRKTGLVFQENFIFNSSVRENIIFGNESVSDTKLLEVAKIAEADEFIEKLPNKYDEVIGERGSTLSGGQKQRLTIARALVNDPEILILDDSTSRLDLITENKIMRNVRIFNPDMTIIIVSQKVSSVEDCDIIYLIDEGKVIAKGNHEELMGTSFTYREIKLAQSNIVNE